MNNKIVVENSAYFRAAARDSLKDNWVISAVAMGIYFVIVGIMNFIVTVFVPGRGPDFVAWIYSWLVVGPAMVGIYAYLLRLRRKESNSIMNVFAGFERFGSAFFLGFLITLFTILWMLLLIIPGIVAAYRYSLAPAIMIDHPEMSAMECINESKRLMMGNKMSMFVLDISFIGWILLSAIPYSLCDTLLTINNIEGIQYVFVLLISQSPILWAAVYVCMANMAFYEDIIKPYPGQNNNSGYQYHRYDGSNDGRDDQYQQYDGQNGGNQYQRYEGSNPDQGYQYQRYEGPNGGAGDQYQKYNGGNGDSMGGTFGIREAGKFDRENYERKNGDGDIRNGFPEENGPEPVDWDNGSKR